MWIASQDGINYSVYLMLRDANGAEVTGLAHDSPGVSCYYVRPLGSPTQISLVTLANAQAAHADGGFVQVSSSNMPGLYRLDLPDAVIEGGENLAIISIGFTGTRRTTFVINLDALPTRVTFEVVDDAANSSSTFKTDLTETASDHWKNAFVTFRTGALAGQTKPASAFNPTTDFLTVSPAFTGEPAAGDKGVLINV